MANANQGLRPGNAFGRLANISYDQPDTQHIALKPGYIARIRDRYHLVVAKEPIAVDLYFTDTLNLGEDNAGNLDGTDGANAMQYGVHSLQAYFDIADNADPADVKGNILKPDYDSGFLSFKDLEPDAGNLYHLCPTLPLQPKYMNAETGDWHSMTEVSPNEGGKPIGFKGDGTSEHLVQIGTVSPRIMIKHPAGVPKHVLDKATEGNSGTVRSETALEGVNGFIDGSMSSPEAPNWDYALWIEHGENNLPTFKMVNDSDEYIIDGKIRLIGWKYRILELTQEQLSVFKQKAGGRLRFVIINSTGLPVSGSMLADYFPK